MNAVNEALIRDVVAEVLGRLGQAAPLPNSTPNAKPDCGCGNGHTTSRAGSNGKHGVFENAEDACAAAQAGFLQLKKKGIEARNKVVEIIKSLADANAVTWGKLELEETKIGR